MNVLFEAPLLKAFFGRYVDEYKLMKIAGVKDDKLRDILNMNLKDYTLLHVLKDKDIDIVDFLLENNFNVENLNENKQTPLHVACGDGNFEIVKRIIEHKANVDANDITNNTPLHFACYFGHFEIVKILIMHKANVDAINKENKRKPIEVAHNKIAEQMREFLDRIKRINDGGGDPHDEILLRDIY